LFLVTAVILALLLGNAPPLVAGTGTPVPVEALTRAAARVPGCITSDDPTILAAMNVLSRDLRAGCELWPDVTGWTYDVDRVMVDGYPVARSRNGAWQQRVVSYLQTGAGVILVRPATGLSSASRRTLTQGPTLFELGQWKIFGINAAGL
jgi:hypothetical protein